MPVYKFGTTGFLNQAVVPGWKFDMLLTNEQFPTSAVLCTCIHAYNLAPDTDLDLYPLSVLHIMDGVFSSQEGR